MVASEIKRNEIIDLLDIATINIRQDGSAYSFKSDLLPVNFFRELTFLHLLEGSENLCSDRQVCL